MKWRKVARSGEKVKWGETKLLIGEYEHSLDAKGRVIMPARLREDMGEKFILTKGLDRMFIWFFTKWMGKLWAKIKNTSTNKQECQGLRKIFPIRSYRMWDGQAR